MRTISVPLIGIVGSNPTQSSMGIKGKAVISERVKKVACKLKKPLDKLLNL